MIGGELGLLASQCDFVGGWMMLDQREMWWILSSN